MRARIFTGWPTERATSLIWLSRRSSGCVQIYVAHHTTGYRQAGAVGDCGRDRRLFKSGPRHDPAAIQERRRALKRPRHERYLPPSLRTRNCCWRVYYASPDARTAIRHYVGNADSLKGLELRPIFAAIVSFNEQARRFLGRYRQSTGAAFPADRDRDRFW